MIESGTIVDHLEKNHPTPSLTVAGMLEATQVQSTFFPAMAKFIKSPQHDSGLEDNLMDQLKKLNDHLECKKTKFFAGDDISLVDFNLAPKLYHFKTTMEAFYPEIYKDKVLKLERLNAYMDTMFENEAFKASVYPQETVLWGWNAARQS